MKPLSPPEGNQKTHDFLLGRDPTFQGHGDARYMFLSIGFPLHRPKNRITRPNGARGASRTPRRRDHGMCEAHVGAVGVHGQLQRGVIRHLTLVRVQVPPSHNRSGEALHPSKTKKHGLMLRKRNFGHVRDSCGTGKSGPEAEFSAMILQIKKSGEQRNSMENLTSE